MLITPISSTINVYSDVNIAVNMSSTDELIFDESSIQMSVARILSTPVGSRVFRRDFGSSLKGLLFQPMDSVTVEMIRSEINRAISRWENRLLLQNVAIRPDLERQQYFVTLAYVIPALNNRQANFVFSLFAG